MSLEEREPVIYSIFYFTETKEGHFAVFKHDGKVLNDLSPCEHLVYAESLAYNWMEKPQNQKKIADIMMELTLIN